MTDMSQDKQPEGFYNRVYGQDAQFEGAHARIQWKGTNVCMDVQCECGEDGHIDADFAYYYYCGKCNNLFAVGEHVKLIKLEGEDRQYVISEVSCIVEDEGPTEAVSKKRMALRLAIENACVRGSVSIEDMLNLLERVQKGRTDV